MGESFSVTLICVAMEWMAKIKWRSLGIENRIAEVHGHYILCKNWSYYVRYDRI